VQLLQVLFILMQASEFLAVSMIQSTHCQEFHLIAARHNAAFVLAQKHDMS
jgi:hypothetical protein